MTDRAKSFLSKSKFIEGLQCRKLLWCEYNRKELFPPVDPATRAVFDEGRRVGEAAQTLFPSGTKVERDLIPEQHHSRSIEALKAGKPVFEAGFTAGRAYAIADILDPSAGGWDLYEVKSATQVRDEYIYDVAFQLHTYRNAGVKVNRCFLMHINSKYVRDGAIEPEKLFLTCDLTEQAESLLLETEGRIESMLDTLSLDRMPDVKIGPYCDEPYECPLKPFCWKFLPEKNNVFMFSRGRQLAFRLLERGVLDMLSVPADIPLSEKQLIQVAAHRSNRPYLDKTALRRFLSTIRYPVFFLDFETIAPAIPPYDLCRPYERIPFQYSLYVMREDGRVEPHSFLAEGAEDPRPAVLARLRDLLGGTGSVVAYNSAFELNTLRDAAAAFPDYGGWVASLEARFVDLLEPFRGFAYYHPAQAGSNSIKNVLPALTGTSYKGMEIANGAIASSEYARVTFTGVPDAERMRVRGALEKYCDLDTRGMIEIVAALRSLSGEG